MYLVPKCFREHTDEDEPEILKNFKGTIAIEIKESSSEVSLDKLYHQFYRNGEPIGQTDPKSKKRVVGAVNENQDAAAASEAAVASREQNYERQRIDKENRDKNVEAVEQQRAAEDWHA